MTMREQNRKRMLYNVANEDCRCAVQDMLTFPHTHPQHSKNTIPVRASLISSICSNIVESHMHINDPKAATYFRVSYTV